MTGFVRAEVERVVVLDRVGSALSRTATSSGALALVRVHRLPARHPLARPRPVHHHQDRLPTHRLHLVIQLIVLWFFHERQSGQIIFCL